MPGARIGPYTLIGTIAAGGMGVVHRAQDARGRMAAVKTVRAPAPSVYASLRREVRVLRRLTHPGIVRFLDAGTDEGSPWYAMEWVDGAPLSGAFGPEGLPSSLPSAGNTWALDDLHADDPLPDPSSPALPRAAAGELSLALTRAFRLCGALAYLHGEGCVHRDLKPANVLVRRDGWPVLVDFGLMVHFGAALSRESADVVAPRVGTPLYIAPEQIRGELVDARADLYALGCLLYELVVGVPPFLGASRTVLDDHLRRAPTPLSEQVADVPLALEELVLALLQKHPDRRPGYAEDVADVLASLGADTTPWPGAPSPRPFLYRPTLVGRSDASRRSARVLDALTERKGQVLLVIGDSGAGKTRFALELLRDAADRGMTLWVGECEDGSSAPLRPLLEPLRLVADTCDRREAADRVFGLRGPVLRAFVPAVGALPGQDELPPPGELPAAMARERLLDAVRETLTAAAESRPAVLLLDDLQWADDLTLAVVSDIAERGGLPGVLLLTTCRADEMNERIRALAAKTATLSLDRLDAGEVQDMIGTMLARAALPEGWARSVAEQAEGNPFFVSELVRVAVSEGQLVRRDGTWQLASDAALPLPATVREVVARRLAGLPGDARSLVLALAVVGREADPAVLGAMVHLDEEPLDHAIDELVRRRVFEPRADRIRFTHDKLREATYADRPEAARAHLHRRAADALLAAGDAPPDILGLHLERGGRSAEAFRAYVQAADDAATNAAYPASVALYQRALALDPGDPEAEVLALQRLVHQLVVVGQVADAVQTLERAMALSDRVGPAFRARTTLLACRAHRAHGDLTLAATLGEQAVEQALAVLPEHDHGRAETLMGAMLPYLDLGRWDEARARGLEALAAARVEGHRRMEGLVLGNLATVQMQQGQLDEATAGFREAMALLDSVGDRRAVAIYAGNVGAIHSFRGALEEAREVLTDAVRVMREVGDRRHEGVYGGNLGLVAWQLGDLEGAERHLTQALSVFEERKDGVHLAQYRISTGWVLLGLGRPHDAWSAIDGAATWYAEREGAPTFIAHTRIARARIARVAWGDVELADRMIEEAEGAGASDDPSVAAMIAAERGMNALSRGEAVDPGPALAHLAAAGLTTDSRTT